MATNSIHIFSDVTPIPQDDGPEPLVAIAYPPTYRQLMDIFRGVIRIEERSERVLQLTEELLAINAANYTVWQYRRECLRSLPPSFTSSELDFLDTFAEENPKNYQLWYHRRCVVEALQDASREKKFTELVFEVDTKNYHAWSHRYVQATHRFTDMYRQWIIATFDLWEDELDFTHKLLLEDVRNNSAWNHRWYVTHSNPHMRASLSDAVVSEMHYAFATVATVAHNESAWNYIRGLVAKHANMTENIALDRLLSLQQQGSNNIFVLELLADIWERSKNKENLTKAIGMFTLLKEEKDVIRAKYWDTRINQCSACLKTM